MKCIRHAWFGWLAAAVLAGAAEPGRAELLDRADGIVEPFLADLAPELHAKNIDVLQRWSSPIVTRVPARERAWLAPLKDYSDRRGRDSPAFEMQEELLRAAWVEGFLDGVHEGLAAAPRLRNGGSFEEAWRRAPQESRIFLSYTRADRASAEAVQLALESKGFVVFTYLDPKGTYRRDPTIVGRLFAEAGRRLVLHSESTPRSLGVLLEAKLEGDLHRRCKELAERRRAAEAAAREAEAGVRQAEAERLQREAIAEKERSAREARVAAERIEWNRARGWPDWVPMGATLAGESGGERFWKLSSARWDGKDYVSESRVYYRRLRSGTL